jgi:pyruvate/2-oxoglutarate dehydrogenase complex dihydrolipoamide acyltransferase (E2) component
MKDPMLAKKNMGTVVVTTLGMMGRFNGWFIPISMHPLTFAIGSIVKKPGVVDNAVAIREYLYVTALVDHDVVDGAPAARGLAKLVKLMEKGSGLREESGAPDPE